MLRVSVWVCYTVTVMKISKFSHACVVIEKDGRSLVIDPGVWSKDLKIPDSVSAVIVTHEHPDHVDGELLEKIKSQNPDCVFLAPESVGESLKNDQFENVTAGQKVTIDGFELEFFGGDHAVIHSSIDVIANLGVMINNAFYYPGDSFVAPFKDVKVLALPAAAPWMKLSDAMDFYALVKPTSAFPTHDAILAQSGKDLADNILSMTAKSIGSKYIRLQPTESIET